MPELDSLRGVAIVLVLFFHGFNFGNLVWSQWSTAGRAFFTAILGGWTGVYLFFVLSGFLITGILLDSKPRPQYYRRFYIRRALRILPAFYLLLFLLVIFARTGWLEHRRVGWPFIGLSFLYLANVTTLFGVPSQYAALWSLAVEEHFYFVWPMIVRRLSHRATVWCALGIFLVSPAIRSAAYRFGWSSGAGYTWLVADGLAIGAMLGALSRGRLAERTPMRNFCLICLSAAVGLFAVGTPFGIWRGVTFVGSVFRLTAVNLFYAGILGGTLLLGTSRFKWIVVSPVLRWFGEISYGLYLVHMLAYDFVDHLTIRYFPAVYPQIPSHMELMFLRFFLSTGVAVTAAFLSRKYFEDWFLQLKERWTSSAPLLAQSPTSTAIGGESAPQTVQVNESRVRRETA
jgi:peptidoglycan/LPS O-acetylase OafA/YrhL